MLDVFFATKWINSTIERMICQNVNAQRMKFAKQMPASVQWNENVYAVDNVKIGCQAMNEQRHSDWKGEREIEREDEKQKERKKVVNKATRRHRDMP